MPFIANFVCSKQHNYMVKIGTTLSPLGKKAVLCGSGELGKEVAIELQRYGVEVVALDRYANAPAMQVAHRSYVLSMLDGAQLRAVIEKEKPDYIIPEIEAIATDTLLELEKEGYNVIPTARATRLTMNREGIRRLAAEELGIPTSPYRFASDYEEFVAAVGQIGTPCVVKPVMSSSGHGQSVVRSSGEIDRAWENSQKGGRAGAGRVIVEGFVDFDYEITLLTVRHCGGTSFLEPIGHYQQDGDYRESWQPQPMNPAVRAQAEEIARRITEALGGWGLFGVELFVRGDRVIFSEVSPRPHDTGMVTLAGTQNLNEFELHCRAVLGLPIPGIKQERIGASAVILSSIASQERPNYRGMEEVAKEEDTYLRIFGKPTTRVNRRMGVVLCYAPLGSDLDTLRDKAKRIAEKVEVY